MTSWPAKKMKVCKVCKVCKTPPPLHTFPVSYWRGTACVGVRAVMPPAHHLGAGL